MKKTTILAIVCVMATVNFALADTFGSGANQFNINFVPISGSTNPTSGYGIVNNDYRMGTYEITNNQWTRFKANIAPMQVTGSPSYAYQLDPGFTGTDVPTNNVSWYEAAQFVNWLNTTSGKSAAYKFTGTQGTGDYSLGVWQSGDAGYNAANPYRNSNAFYFLPTEDEWVKAAYWNGLDLQNYATKAGESLYQGNGSNGGWNYDYYTMQQPWVVGSGSEELNGTFDMMGNVWEWMESPTYLTWGYQSDSGREVRGGSFWEVTDYYLASSVRGGDNSPSNEVSTLGIRVASVPEPCSLALLFLGGLALRYRKQ